MANPPEFVVAATEAVPVIELTNDAADAGTPRPRRHTLNFSEALAHVERHRNAVRATLAAALLIRLTFEFHLVAVARGQMSIDAELPSIGLALLAYLVVLWFLATRTRDRFGFGMALGIGVLEATYLIVMAAMVRPFALDTTWPLLVIALAHLPLAMTAMHAATAFPPHDGKRPWLIGFGAALVFVAVPWVAPLVMAGITHSS